MRKAAAATSIMLPRATFVDREIAAARSLLAGGPAARLAPDVSEKHHERASADRLRVPCNRTFRALASVTLAVAEAPGRVVQGRSAYYRIRSAVISLF